jgi:hypothetical protein
LDADASPDSISKTFLPFNQPLQMMFSCQKRVRALRKADLTDTNHFKGQIKHNNSASGPKDSNLIQGVAKAL